MPIRLLSAFGEGTQRDKSSVAIMQLHGQRICDPQCSAWAWEALCAECGSEADSSLPPRVAQLSEQDGPISSLFSLPCQKSTGHESSAHVQLRGIAARTGVQILLLHSTLPTRCKALDKLLFLK